MSRCFPYPPPGYVKKGIHDEAPIESIKAKHYSGLGSDLRSQLPREDDKAKKEKKREKKREKKEKKARENGEIEDKKHRHKKRDKDERHQDSKKGRDHEKKRKQETEILKSSLTEEHGHPAGSQNSSDSTLNSNKRQKQNSSPNGKQNPGIFRIRLPLQRHKDPEVLPREEQPCQLTLQGHKDPEVLPRKQQWVPLQGHKDHEVLPREQQRVPLQRHKDSEVLPREQLRVPLQRHKHPEVLPREQLRVPLQRHKHPEVLPSKEQPCSASGRTDNAFVRGMHEPSPRQGRDEGEHPCSTSGNVGQELPSRLSKEKPSPSLQATGSGSPSIASQYRELIENWDHPPLLQSLPMDCGDQGWLFETKKSQNCGVEKHRVVSDNLSYGDSTSWPCARHLPEADIYALPFTVPF